MTSLNVPCLPQLSGLDAESIIQIMEEKATRQSLGYVNWPDQYPYNPITVFNIARDHEKLYINFFVRGNCLKAEYEEDLSPVWTDSCVEFFARVPGSETYLNFEFNCIGACYAARRVTRADFTLLNADELKVIERYPNLGKKPFREMQGLFTWDLLIAIPFQLMGLDGSDLPEKITGNFYKCADKTALPHFLSWAPIDTPKPDFHRPEFFGDIYFI